MSTRQRVGRFLAPGELVVDSRDINIKTIVGSCVSVCLWDAGRHCGGVNHYLLPRPLSGDVPGPRFGSTAIEHLLEGLGRLGCTLCRLEAAVIGGGHPVTAFSAGGVGDENVRVALEVLAGRGIRIARQATGGDHGRKPLFNPHTGALLVRNLRGRAAVVSAVP